MNKIVVDQFEFNILDNPKYNNKNELINLYWSFHPRLKFFKTLPADSRLLDLGAGSGGLYHWREWGRPNRNDLKLYAIDMNQGSLFDKYEDYQICNLDKDSIKFEDDMFDAILMSHLLEHIRDTDKLFSEINRLLKKGGRLYIEIPSPETLTYPKRDKFVAKGVNSVITNFFDDCTHFRTYNLEELNKMAGKYGLDEVESGVIDCKYLEDELFTYGFNNNHDGCITFCVWSKLKWASYMVLEKKV